MNRTTKDLHQKRMKMWDASIDNHNKYINSKTCLFDDKFVEYRHCPVCGSDNEQEIFTKAGGRYVKCCDCTMVYLNPVFKDFALKDYYERNHSVQSQIVENDPDDFYSKLYKKGLESIKSVNPNIRNILDIGCSSGVFLDIAKTQNLKTYGVELNKTEYDYAKNKGHMVYNDLLENITFEEKFDAISMWDVFEHLKDGEFYLNYLKNLLSDQGVIFLQIPSSDSLAAKILQEQCNMFDGLEHVNLFGVETIKQLAHKCGLLIIDLKTVISEIGVINNYLGYEHPYLGDIQNKNNILNIIDEDTLHKNLLGYKLQIVLGVDK
jgi:SAM-dependent methyltransferase